MNNSLVAVKASDYNLSEEKEKEALAVISPYTEKLITMQDEYAAIINGPKDYANAEAAANLRISIKKNVRLPISKEIDKFSLETRNLTKFYSAVKKECESNCKDKEAELKEIEDYVEKQKEEEQNRLQQERSSEIMSLGGIPNGGLGILDETTYNLVIIGLKAEAKKKEEEAKVKAERDALEQSWMKKLGPIAEYVTGEVDYSTLIQETFDIIYERALEGKKQAEEIARAEHIANIRTAEMSQLLPFVDPAINYTSLTDDEYTMFKGEALKAKKEKEEKRAKLDAIAKDRQEKLSKIDCVLPFDECRDMSEDAWLALYNKLCGEYKALQKAKQDIAIRCQDAMDFLLNNEFTVKGEGLTAKDYTHFIGFNNFNNLQSDKELEAFKTDVLYTKDRELKLIEERKEIEKQAKQIQEEKDKKVKELEEKRKAAAAPDVEKVKVFAQMLLDIEIPSVTDATCVKLLKDSKGLLAKINKHILDNLNK